jgi:hypothetical protein
MKPLGADPGYRVVKNRMQACSLRSPLKLITYETILCSAARDCCTPL